MVPLTSIIEDFRIDPHWPAMQSNSGSWRLRRLWAANYRVRSMSPARKGQRELGRYNRRSKDASSTRHAQPGSRLLNRLWSLSQRFVCTSRWILRSPTNWENVTNSKSSCRFFMPTFQTITTFVPGHRSGPGHDPIRNVDHVDDQQPLIEKKRQVHGAIEAEMKSEQRTTEQRRHAAIEQRQRRAQFQRQPAAGDERNDPAVRGRKIRHPQL